jgi:hypothetical protein
MKLLVTLVTFLLVFVGTAPHVDGHGLCGIQTDFIQLNDGLEEATLAYNVAVVNQTLMCNKTAQSPSELNLDSEESAIEQACTEADGMMYTPSLSVQCDNSNTKVTTTLVNQYAFCIGLNCTETHDLEEEANELLANATAAVNVFLKPNGVACSTQVSSDGNLILCSRGAAAIGIVTSAVMLFITLY